VLASRATLGNPDLGDRWWQRYREPLAASDGQTCWFCAQRLGLRASDDVVIAV
jgi:hypothetical protein